MTTLNSLLIMRCCGDHGTREGNAALEALANQGVQQIDQFNGHELTVFARVLTDSHTGKGEWAAAIADHACTLSGTLRPHHVSVMLRCIATMGAATPRFLEALCQRAAAVATSFTPKDASTLVGALGACKYRHGDLQDKLAPHVAGMVGDFSPQGLATLMMGYARLGLAPPQVTQVVAKHVISQPPGELGPRVVANLMYSWGELRLPSLEVVAALCVCIEGNGSQLSPQEVAMTVPPQCKHEA